eukprot:jgi/Mesvir1/17637/Mv08859-RA.1
MLLAGRVLLARDIALSAPISATLKQASGIQSWSEQRSPPLRWGAVRPLVGDRSHRPARGHTRPLPIAPPPRPSRFATSPRAAMKADPDCIFCKIVKGDLPSYKVLETPTALAFLDAFPLARGHTLLIPKEHHAGIHDCPRDVMADVAGELPRLAAAVKASTGAEGINIVQNNGSAAGQVVFHVHFHIIPRVPGDGLVRFGRSKPKLEAADAEDVKGMILAKLS